jgi:hypothetical protein
MRLWRTPSSGPNLQRQKGDEPLRTLKGFGLVFGLTSALTMVVTTFMLSATSVSAQFTPATLFGTVTIQI